MTDKDKIAVLGERIETLEFWIREQKEEIEELYAEVDYWKDKYYDAMEG